MADDAGQTLLRSNTINADNHGAIITITTVLLLTTSLLFYCFRLFTRWPLDRLFGWDDTAISIATLLSISQATVTFLAVSSGLGKRETLLAPSEVDRTYSLMFAGDLLYVLALCPAKLASSLLVYRLTQFRSHLIVTRIVSGIIVAWGIISVVVVALPCPDGSQPGRGTYVCSNSMARWTGITVTSMITEAMLLILPVYMLWRLSLRMSAKFIVVLAFWSRLPLLALSVLRLQSLSTALPSSNLTFAITMTEVYTQLDLHYSILTATISSLRPFLKLFNSGFLATTTAQVQQSMVRPSSPVMRQRLADQSTAPSMDSTFSTEHDAQ